eukprot:1897393-Pleurochrysis_carterae.AAC.1
MSHDGSTSGKSNSQYILPLPSEMYTKLMMHKINTRSGMRHEPLFVPALSFPFLSFNASYMLR